MILKNYDEDGNEIRGGSSSKKWRFFPDNFCCSLCIHQDRWLITGVPSTRDRIGVVLMPQILDNQRVALSHVDTKMLPNTERELGHKKVA